MGSDLGDFLPAPIVVAWRSNQLAASDLQRLDALTPNFGRAWFLLPNPAYGFWERALRAQYCPQQ